MAYPLPLGGLFGFQFLVSFPKDAIKNFVRNPLSLDRLIFADPLSDGIFHRRNKLPNIMSDAHIRPEFDKKALHD